MLIVCPACASAYEIDAERLGAAGRSVRCAACRETWFITPESVAAADTAPDADALGAQAFAAADETPFAGPPQDETAQDETATVIDEPRPGRRRSAKATKPGANRTSRFRALSPALAVGLVVFAMVPLALLGRSTLVRAMPQTAALFSGIGLPVNLRGIALRNVAAFQTPAEACRPAELIIEGDLFGVSRERVDIARIAIEVRDDHGASLKRWTIAAPRSALEAGETARFRASLPAPPERGRSVQVGFADADADADADALEANQAGSKTAKMEQGETAHPASHDPAVPAPARPDANAH